VQITELASYLLLSLAAIAITAAVWFAVQRPSPSREFGRAAWQTGQACLAALAALIAAMCVLAAIALLT
jgi:hypothetical protein